MSGRVAVLGWGSLVWRPRNRHGELQIEEPWHGDGPFLPVEFARISADGRLTLVLLPGAAVKSRVLWACSRFDRVDDAIANLARRETRAPRRSIHGLGVAGEVFGEPDPRVVAAVADWLEPRHLDAVIWTGLSPGDRWPEVGAVGFSPDGAVAYVAGLEGETRALAAEYIRRAPPQIDTPLRRRLQAVLEETSEQPETG